VDRSESGERCVTCDEDDGLGRTGAARLELIFSAGVPRIITGRGRDVCRSGISDRPSSGSTSAT